MRAYTDAVKAVLENLSLAEKVPTHTVMLTIPYTLYEQAKKLIEQQEGKILDEEFAAEVTISIQFIVEKFENFNEGIIELSRGKIKAEIIETNPDTLFEISLPSE